MTGGMDKGDSNRAESGGGEVRGLLSVRGYRGPPQPYSGYFQRGIEDEEVLVFESRRCVAQQEQPHLPPLL